MVILWILGYFAIGVFITTVVKLYMEKEQHMDMGVFFCSVVFWPLSLLWFICVLLADLMMWLLKHS